MQLLNYGLDDLMIHVVSQAMSGSDIFTPQIRSKF